MTSTLARELSWKFPLMRGDDVREVQRALIRDGSLIGSADGIFGPATHDGVVAFQRKLRARNPTIDVDGIVGRDTWSALFSNRASADPVPQIRVPPSAIADQGDWRDLIRPYVERLSKRHGAPQQAPGGQTWRLTSQGIVVGDETKARRSGGEPQTLTRIWRDFRAPIEKCAAAYGVPLELILATIATESGGNPNALREEPGFTSDEATPHRVSPGLMQTLISTARGTLNDPSIDRAKLLDPETSIRAGTAYIRQQARITNFDPPLVACAYNAGNCYPQEGSDNPWRLRQYPIGTGKHADRFVAWFGDALEVVRASPPQETTPSFASLL
ncbi:transglycosylase SLT domain-containing protein [Elioraea rosea]|uniref:transglycosylase SLT domain-containing protein n=1 Tax=Elioraea rosea TaxID=2492390 RepID=UPI0013157D54|nr:transglycosylase SLT domain-containing protein [Elioraea rosea]